MGMSKLKAGVWMRFLECFVDCLSLRKCAQRCGVCLKTAFLMRQRVIECIRRYTPVLRSEAGSCVQLDETYFRESFKGNHTKSAVFVMPRKARKRTKSLRKRGLSKEQICVATGVDDTGRSFLTVCGRGVISKDRAMSALKPHIGRGADVLTDGASAYVKPLAELGANLTQTDADDHAINRVNTLHARLEDFMFGFHGVSTKYLQAYLDWFQWLGAFTDGCGDTGDDRLLARQLGNGLYRIRRRDYQRMTPPYMDYWRKAA